MSEHNESNLFVLQGADVKAFKDHLYRLGWPDPDEPSRRRLSGICFGVLSQAVLCFYFIIEGVGSGKASVLAILLAVPAVCSIVMLAVQLFSFANNWWRGRRMGWDLPRLAQTRKKSPWQVTITPEGIWYNNEGATSFLLWSVIWDIYGTPDHAFIWTGERQVILVPRRAFASQAKFIEFVRQAAHHCKEDDISSHFAESRGQTGSGVCLLEQAITNRRGDHQSQIRDQEPIQDHP